jgi:hypothetical protein
MFALSQSRKLRIDLVYTAQDIEQVDSFLRRLTQWIHRVRAFPAPSTHRQESGKRPWFFMVNTYRPGGIKDGIERPDRRVRREFLRYHRAHEAWYDTDELVAPAARLTRKRGPRRSKEYQDEAQGSERPPGGPVGAEDGATGALAQS